MGYGYVLPAVTFSGENIENIRTCIVAFIVKLFRGEVGRRDEERRREGRKKLGRELMIQILST